MIAEYVTTQPWNKNLLNGWKGTRSKGWRPGLAFSGGFDSTAAMLLMHTALCYHKRVNVQGSLDHTNADHMIAEIAKHQGRIVTVVESDHESVRASLGSGTGFATDFSPAAALILLADHLGLDSIALGLPLENSFFFHGHRPRDFLNSGYWNLYFNLFSSIGLDLFYPTGGCSEIVNIEIVKASGLQHLAQSCLRSNEVGSGCGKCWKCFRKNSMLGRKVEFSNEVDLPEEATIEASDFNTLCRSETAESLTKESHRNRRTGWCHRHGFVVSQQICQPRWSIGSKTISRRLPSHVG